MADLKFRTGASATVQKEDSLEKKLAGIIGTTTGAIKSLESQLRRDREAEEARKKAEEEARKRAEAAARAEATPQTTTTSRPVDTQYITDLQKQRAQLQRAASAGDRTAAQKINDINRQLQDAQKGATAPTVQTAPVTQPTRDFSWETDETVLQREKELATAKTNVAREAQRKSENYVERQGRKLDAMEEELKRLRAAAHNGDTESGKAYNELLGRYNTALDLYNQASALANRREAQFYEGIEEIRQINQQIAGTQKYSDDVGAIYEAEYNAAKDALDAATVLASDYNTAVVPGYSDYIYDQVKAAEERFARADEEFTLWKQEREAYLREKTLRGISDEDLSLFREVLNNRDRNVESSLRKKYGDEYDTILMFIRRQANAEKWSERGAWIEERGTVGNALLSVASVATNLLSTPGVIYEYVVQNRNGDKYLPLDTNAGGFWMQNATRKIRESVTDDIESDAWDLIYQTAMSGVDSYLTARIFGSKATYVLGATAGANAATDITNRGGTVQQAVVGGILAGTIEGFFESFSVGQMQALQSQTLNINTLQDAIDPKNIKTLVANVAKSTGVNFSEEANTEMANIVMDTLLMGDLSEVALSIQKLMAEDPTLDEHAAKKIVAAELATQVVLSGVSGALMGAAFGALDTATAGFRTYALNTDTREVLRQAQQTAATLPWEWRPEFRYEAGASYEQVNSYAEKVYNAAQEYLVEMQNNEALNPEETANVRDAVSSLVNVRVRTKTTVDKVLAAEEAGREAADAEASVSPQVDANAQDANVVGAEENAQAVGAQQESEAVALARELLQEHANTYSGEALAREVANTVQILKNEGRFDISDAFEAEYNNYINGGNTNGEAGQAGVLLSDGQRRVYAESAGGQASADGRTYERGSAAGGTRAESTQSGSGVQQTVWKPQVKSSELVASGTSKTVRMVPEAEYSNENYADAVAEIKRAGFTPVLVRDALTVRNTNGSTLRVNGVATPDGRIVLRVGADKTQNRKLGRHEIFHAMFMKAKNRAAIMDRILTTLKNKYSEAEITDMLNVYFDKYRNTYSDENRIIEEFLADAYAGMNRFDEAKVDKYEKAVVGAATAESLAMETEENGDAGDWYADGGNNANANLTFAVPYDRISQNPRYKRLYAEAKSGNDVAAAKLINALTNRDFFETIRKKFAGSTLLPLMGTENVSDNVLPGLLAKKISRITGLPVEDRVFKTTSNHMRSRSPEERLTENIDFDIDAENTAELSGKHFVIVDDTIATGTTVNSLARWIEARGGVVDGFVSLAKGKDTVSSFQITPEQIRMLERRYGRSAVEAVIREYGYADRIEDLTRRQADIIDRKHTELGLTPIDPRRGTRTDRAYQSENQSRRASSLKPNEATEENLDGFSIAEEEVDSDGNALSEQQAEYFAESQARDTQGRLLRLYHQTGDLFTVFDTRREGAGSRDDGTPFGIFLKTSDRDIGLKGKFQMPLYANITNPLRVNNREELRRELEYLSAEYALLLEKHSQLDDEYHERFEAAKRELRSFMTEWRKNNPQASRTALYEVPEFDRLYNAEDEIVEEWTKEADKISTQAKEVLTQALRDAGYDGVIINTDAGSFGRSTDAFIALDANQVKNTDNLTPTDNPDIRYSVEETEEERMIREDTEAREGVIRQFAEDYGLADRIEDARDVAAGRKEFSDLDLDNSNDLHNMADLVRRFLQAKNSGYDRILAEFGGLKINETAAPKPPEPKVSAFRSNTLKKILGDKAEKYFRTEDYTYLPISEQESLRSARDRLNTDAEGVIEYLRKSEGWGSSDMDAAYAIMGILKHEADVTHDYSRLNEWVKLMREQNTRAGQMIQANAKYSRNPYTLLLKADEIIETLRQEAVKNKANEQEMQEVEDLVNKIHENTSNQIAAIEAAGENVNSLVDVILKNAEIRKNKISRRIINSLRTQDVDFLRNVAIAQVENIAVDNVRRSAAQKISTYQTMAQLLNLRTGMRNVTSNQVFDVLESFVTNVSAPVDAFIGLMTKQRGVGLDASWFSKEKRQGAKNAAVRSAIEVSLDVEVGDGNSKYGTKNRRTWNMQTSGVVGRTMSHLEKVMGYELNVTDEFLKGSVYSEAMRGFQKFIDNGTLSLEDAQEMARQEALYRSFQDDTKFSQLLRKTKEALNIVGIKNGHLSFGLGDFVQKYTQVPGALISRAVEFSPLGYIKAIAAACQIRHNGNINVMAQRQTALSFGRATTGTGLIVAFAALAKLGILRRRDDEENKDVAALSDSEGIYGTQINWSALMRLLRGEDTAWKKGDVLIDFDFMEPINAIMAIGTAVAGSEGETFGERATAVGKESLAALFDSILESSLFQTWQQLADAMRYSQSEGLDAWADFGMGFIASSITGFVPSFVRQIAQATDYAYRDQYYSQNKKSQVFARFINTIPGLRQALPEKLDNFGDVKDYEDPWINALNSLVMPGGIYVYERGEISEELARLREATGEDGMYPSRYAPYNLELNLGGGKREKHELTPEERTRFQTTRGTTASLLMAEYMASAAYENASDEQRAAILTTIKNIAEDTAKRELYESLGIQYRTDTHDKYYGLVAAGVSSSDALDLQYRNSALQKYYSFLSDGATDSADAQLALLKEMGVEITGVQNLDKLALIRQYNVPNSAFVEMATEFINDSRGEDFAIMLDAGLTQEDVEILFNEYTRLSKDESMSAFDKATEFAHYVDVMGIKNDARNVALDTLTYSSGFRATADTYQKYVDAGLDADTAKSIYDAINALEPLPGNDSVSAWQRRQATVSVLDDVDQQIAAYVAGENAENREKAKAKLGAAKAYDVTPKMYVDFYMSVQDTDGSGGVSQDEVKAVLRNRTDLTNEQKAVLYQLYNTNWKYYTNPYNTTAARSIIDALATAKE